ncbi:MAG: YraN family protein, partial [Armatimonadota bacterium]|nr:YraN family protein [Armatimonadota bacterium]
CRLGEVDLVAEEGEHLVFVEVKARTSLNRGLPREAVDQRKQRRVQRAACCYAAEQGDLRPWRFDVVEVVAVGGGPPECFLIRDAYQVDERFLESSWE